MFFFLKDLYRLHIKVVFYFFIIFFCIFYSGYYSIKLYKNNPLDSKCSLYWGIFENFCLNSIYISKNSDLLKNDLFNMFFKKIIFLKSFEDTYINKDILDTCIGNIDLPYFKKGNLLYGDIKVFLQEQSFVLHEEVKHNIFNRFIDGLFFTTTTISYDKVDIFLKHIHTDVNSILYNINCDVLLPKYKFNAEKRINYLRNRSKFTSRMLKELQLSYVSFGASYFSKGQIITVYKLLRYYRKHISLFEDNKLIYSTIGPFNTYRTTLDTYISTKKYKFKHKRLIKYGKNVKVENNFNSINFFLRECFTYKLYNVTFLQNKKKSVNNLLDSSNSILNIMKVFNLPVEETTFFNPLDFYYCNIHNNTLFKEILIGFIKFEYLTGNLFIYKDLEYLKTIQRDFISSIFLLRNIFLDNFVFNNYSTFKYLCSSVNTRDFLNIYLNRDFLMGDLYTYECISQLHRQRENRHNNLSILIYDNLNMKLMPLYKDDALVYNDMIYVSKQQIANSIYKFIKCVQ